MTKFWKPALLLVAVAVMAFGMLSSGAWFSDTATSNASSFKAGTLSIDNGKIVSAPVVTITNMAPGDETGPISIVIENNGTLDLGWIGNMVISDSALKDVIYIKSATMEFLTPTGTWLAADNFIANGLGYTNLGGNSLATLANFDNNPGMLPASEYEFMGALKPGNSYRLTMNFAMLESASNDYQNAGPLTVNLQVNATQLNLTALKAMNGAFLQDHLNWMNDWIDAQE